MLNIFIVLLIFLWSLVKAAEYTLRQGGRCRIKSSQVISQLHVTRWLDFKLVPREPYPKAKKKPRERDLVKVYSCPQLSILIIPNLNSRSCCK